MVSFLIKGYLLGLAISAPVGPINLLCMRRSLTRSSRIGFLTGLGAAVGDAFYGAVAAFGLTWISDFFVVYQSQLQIFGGIFFAIMGVKIMRSPPPHEVGDVKTLSGWKAFVSTMALTLTNPATVLAFIAAFASLKLGSGSKDFSDAIAITAGVFLGSASWWLFLSSISARFRHILTPQTIHRINLGAGILLFGFAGFLIIKGSYSLGIF